MPTAFAPLAATFLATILLFDLVTVKPEFSWFDKGHRVVGLIAQGHLTVAATQGD